MTRRSTVAALGAVVLLAGSPVVAEEFDDTGEGQGEYAAHAATEDADPWIGGPFTRFAVHSTTPFALADAPNFSWTAGDVDADGRVEVIGVKTRNVGYGKAEVHALQGTDFTRFARQNVTPIAASDAHNFSWVAGDYNLDRRADVFAIKTSQTGSGRVEVHVLDGAAGFGRFLSQSVTPITAADAPNFRWAAGDYNGDGRADILAIKTANVGYGKAEVHVLDGAATFGRFLSQSLTPIAVDDAPNFAWAGGDYDRNGRTDLFAVKTARAGTATAEVHVLDGAATFGRFLAQTGTPITIEDAPNFAWAAGESNGDGRADVVSIKTANAGSGTVEVHVLDAAAQPGESFHDDFPTERDPSAPERTAAKQWHGVPVHDPDPVLFLHGISIGSGGEDCDNWNELRNFVQDAGYQTVRSNLVTLEYYTADVDCTGSVNHHGSHDRHYGHDGGHTNDTNIRHLGYHFAWYVWDHYSRHGVPVGVVAHSMGGLIARYAVAKAGTPRFPPEVVIRDVVTLGTPHRGSSWCWPFTIDHTDVYECRQMVPGSSFMDWLHKHAQGPQGSRTTATNWTLIGSADDQWVPRRSAMGMNAAHKVTYYKPSYGHGGLRDAELGVGPYTADVRYVDYGVYHDWYEAPRNFRWIVQALWSHSW